MVSSWTSCCCLHLLTFHSQLGALNDNINTIPHTYLFNVHFREQPALITIQFLIVILLIIAVTPYPPG